MAEFEEIALVEVDDVDDEVVDGVDDVEDVTDVLELLVLVVGEVDVAVPEAEPETVEVLEPVDVALVSTDDVDAVGEDELLVSVVDPELAPVGVLCPDELLDAVVDVPDVVTIDVLLVPEELPLVAPSPGEPASPASSAGGGVPVSILPRMLRTSRCWAMVPSRDAPESGRAVPASTPPDTLASTVASEPPAHPPSRAAPIPSETSVLHVVLAKPIIVPSPWQRGSPRLLCNVRRYVAR